MQKTLHFTIDKKHILNSNTYKSLHWAVKGKITETLRTLSVTEGLKHHDEANHPVIEERLSALKAIANQAVAKARRTKALQKRDDLSAKEIKEMVEKEFAEEVLADPAMPELPRLFNTYKIRVVVAPPTRRRLDPVNLYPTVKAIIDGLTDVAWWEDDDFTHLVELSFVYGGLSGEKDTFKLAMEVSEVIGDELANYVTTSEVVK